MLLTLTDPRGNNVQLNNYWFETSSDKLGNLCGVHIDNFPTNQLVKEFWKSIHICQSYYQTSTDQTSNFQQCLSPACRACDYVYIDYVRRSRSSSCRLLRPINCHTYITLHYITLRYTFCDTVHNTPAQRRPRQIDQRNRAVFPRLQSARHTTDLRSIVPTAAASCRSHHPSTDKDVFTQRYFVENSADIGC